MTKMILLTTLCAGLYGQAVTLEERSKVIQELERTRDLLLSASEKVSASQATFKQAPERWSVLQCVEHLALSEEAILGLIQKVGKGPEASDADKAKTQGKTALLERALPDRSRKATAPVEIAPSGKFATLAEAREAYQTARNRTIEFAKTTEIPLHSFVTKHMAFAELDLYQWLMLTAGHTVRHTLQLEEVKAAMVK